MHRDEFTCDGKATSLSAYPQEFVDYIEYREDQNKSTAYSNWFNDYKAQADIQNNDMPENVPYNLDMTKYDNSDSSSDNSDGSTDGASADTNADASVTEDRRNLPASRTPILRILASNNQVIRLFPRPPRMRWP